MRLERNILWIISAVAIGVWLADAAMDSFLFGHGTFWDAVFFDVTNREIFLRLFFISIYSLFAFLLSRILSKKARVHDELIKHATAIEMAMDGIALFNDKHEYVFVNEAYARITGFKNPSELVGRDYTAVYDEQQIAQLKEKVFPELEHSGRWHGELTAHRKDGSLFDQEASITRLADGSCVCVMRDITERKKKEDDITRSERFLQMIFDSIRDPFCIFDSDYRIVRANDAYARLKQRAVEDIVGKTCFKVLEGRDNVCDGCIIQTTLQSGDPCAKEKKVLLKTGEEMWLEIYSYPIEDRDGRVTHVIEYTRDITERKRAEDDHKRLIKRLEYLSSIDGLTGLLNRRALTEQLEYEIDRARRYNAELSLILCDLDNLKEINDTYGHRAGDLAIQLVSATLRNSLRNADIAGRYGGDEFLIIAPQTSLEGAKSIAEKIIIALQDTELPLDKTTRLAVSVSLGVAGLKSSDEDMDSLVSRVDAALYNSKSAGRNRLSLAE